MAVGRDDSVLITKVNSEHVNVGQVDGFSDDSDRDKLSSEMSTNDSQSENKMNGTIMDDHVFLYPPDADSHFKCVLQKSPKFLQTYTERTIQLEQSSNEFGSQTKRNLPDYYYKNSGDPASNRWLRSRSRNSSSRNSSSRCSRPHSSRMSSAASVRSRPPSRQGTANQLPGMENPRCFASEGNNFEIVTPLESASFALRSFARSEPAPRKHPNSSKFPGIRSVRFGDVRNGYTSLPPTPVTSQAQRQPPQPHRPSSSSSGRPQSW